MNRTRTFLLGIFLLGMVVGLLLIVPIAYATTTTRANRQEPSVSLDEQIPVMESLGLRVPSSPLSAGLV
jgi:hypothetical protein